MTDWPITRRTMLKGVGATLALPLLEVMRPVQSLATEATVHPTRMAVLYMPNGVNPTNWTPKGLGRDFELTPGLEPLRKFKDDLVILSQLWNKAANTGDGHYVKTGGFLTSTTITRTTDDNIRSNGISMDQLAARKIGLLTPLPSIELGVEPPATGVDANVGYTQLYGAHISWSTPSTPLAKEINPKLAFDRIFRRDTALSPQDRALAAVRDKSVLDLVLEDAKRLQSRLGINDREKLGEYLESVRAVEKRIEWDAKRQRETVMNDPLARAAIDDLGRRVDAYSDPGRVSERAGNHTEQVRLMFDLMALAFWTDSTRVATFMFGNAVSSRSFAFLGDGFGGHHQTSHHENKEDKLAQYLRINQWHTEQYAYFLEKLKSIKEGDSNLLDRSMIVFGAGMRDGNAHNPHDLPLLLAGRAGGTIATGRHLTYEKNTPLANLWVSLLKRMGAPQNRFADATGELPGLDDPGFKGTGAPA